MFLDNQVFTYKDIISELRDMTLSGESDLHLQADTPPYKRNLQRELEDLEGRIEGVPQRIIPEQVLFELAYLVCRGTPFTERLRALAAYTRNIRSKYRSLAVDLDLEYEDPNPLQPDELLPDEPEDSLLPERYDLSPPTAQMLVFQPFDVAFDVLTCDEEGNEIKGRYRVHVYRSEPVSPLGSGLCLSFRRIWPVLPTLKQLRFSPAAGSLVYDLMNGTISSGLILVVGSTGSGKSTTVGAMLEAVNDRLPVNITLFEDPPEYRFTNRRARFRQIYVGRDVASYTEGAKHALRQDPDIIVVGEIRDEDMANQALAMAKTGHLVIGTMHSSTNAPAALLKFLQMTGDDFFSISNHLQAIIAQKILPPKHRYSLDDNGVQQATLPVLIQEVMRPTKNKQIQALLRTQSDDPYAYYLAIGTENTETLILEESFGTALKNAVEQSLIYNSMVLKAAERDEDAAIGGSYRKSGRLSGKHRAPEFLRNRNQKTGPLDTSDQ